MKWLFSFLTVLVFATGLSAQDGLFIFIQEGSGRAFYVRQGDKSYSSTAAGHLTLSGFHDSVYHLYLGYPGSVGNERLFDVEMKGSNRGFIINSDAAGWKLTDLQTQQVVPAVGEKSADTTSMGNRRTDSYSELMAGVVSDSAVLYTPVVAKNNSKIKGSDVDKPGHPEQPVDSIRSLSQPKVVSDSVAIRDTAALIADIGRDSAARVSKPIQPVSDNAPHAADSATQGRDTISLVHDVNGKIPEDSMRAGVDSGAPQIANRNVRDTVSRAADSTQKIAADKINIKRDSLNNNNNNKDSISDVANTSFKPEKDTVKTRLDSVNNPFFRPANGVDSTKIPATASRPPVPVKGKENVVTKKDSLRAPVMDSAAVRAAAKPALAAISRASDKNIIRLETQNRQEGKTMVYIDRSGAVTDTIRILIPRQ